MPVKIIVNQDAKVLIEKDGFAPIQYYRLHKKLTLKRLLIGDEGRQFPTLSISFTVMRRPGFVIFNVLAPLFVMPSSPPSRWRSRAKTWPTASASR